MPQLSDTATLQHKTVRTVRGGGGHSVVITGRLLKNRTFTFDIQATVSRSRPSTRQHGQCKANFEVKWLPLLVKLFFTRFKLNILMFVVYFVLFRGWGGVCVWTESQWPAGTWP